MSDKQEISLWLRPVWQPVQFLGVSKLSSSNGANSHYSAAVNIVLTSLMSEFRACQTALHFISQKMQPRPIFPVSVEKCIREKRKHVEAGSDGRSENTNVSCSQKRIISLTYNTEGLASEFQPPSPSSVATAAASSPEPHYILHTKHHDGHNFLRRCGDISHYQ